MHMLTLLISLFLVQPVVEYWLHRLVHDLLLQYHVDHHRNWSQGKYWNYVGDRAARGAVLCLALIGWYTAAFMLLKYEIMHTVVHRWPGFKRMHRHHFLHHRNPSCNYSFSAIWPDRLFGTLAE
jgi:sterol desaturase/sphingolipid hydroxylase (fatty acid hydroxylase superfamily)